MQGCARRLCAVFSVARPHSHVVFPSKYFHFFRCSLLHVYPVRSLLRHLHVVHGLSCPLARLSSSLTEVRWGVLFVLISHSLHLMTLGGTFAGFTECRKQFLDFKRLSAWIFPYKEWAPFVSCLAYSTLAHTSRLMLGGAIPDKYNSCTLGGYIPLLVGMHYWALNPVCKHVLISPILGQDTQPRNNLVPKLLFWLYLGWFPT